MVTEFWALYASILNYYFDDRKTTIVEYISTYKKSWNNFTGIIGRADLINDNRFSKELKEISKSGKDKTEFLLRLLFLYDLNTVENIRLREHSYDNTTRKL